jgi:phosphoribosylaminoimidazole carboxylase (NCAIR synthetase)
MNVIMISPGYPAEMPLFTRGLAAVGASVFGVGDQPQAALEAQVRKSLDGYLQVKDLWDEAAVVAQVTERVRGQKIDRVECLWEPGMMLAARLREALGAPGLSVEQTVPFRDKETMKVRLDAAGIRTPKHVRARTRAECYAAAEKFGYPLIIKPIAGAGSQDTYPLREQADLIRALELLEHVEEVSVEEFIEGEEYTYDTICADGKILYENVAWYRPKPLVARLNEWISAQAIALRDIETPEIAVGRKLGHDVIRALGFKTGFTHMEWFRNPRGEAVFGEIGGRPPGARLVHVMNYSCDIDLFSGWAEAVCHGRLSQSTEKKYNAAVIFKRAQGPGQIIRRVENLDTLLARYGESIVNIDLVPVGQPRRDWRKIAVGDGWVVVRHPDLGTTLEIADRVSTDLRLIAS